MVWLPALQDQPQLQIHPLHWLIICISVQIFIKIVHQEYWSADAVTQFMKDAPLTYDKNEHTLAVFLDFRKAFDTIDHKLL